MSDPYLRLLSRLMLHTNPLPTQSDTFIRESHSRLYSPEVFAISQLLSEIPNSIVCAVVYWALMVYPTGFGAGSAGLKGTGFQLLAVMFTEFFGVTLSQLFGALTPSIQVRPLFLSPCPLDPRVADLFCLFLLLADWDVVQLGDCHSALRYLRRRHSVPRHSGLVTSVVV